MSLVVLAASVYLLITTAPRLGLDLRGGTQITLETKDSPTTVADATSTDRALEVLRKRVDALGVAEPLIARSGENRIIIELPGLQDPREAVEVIGRTAQLTFHQITPDGRQVPDESGSQIPIGPAAFTGEGVENATSSADPQSVGYQVNIDFNGTGARQWEDLTGQAACSPPGDPGRRIAIVLDDKVISSPQVDPSIQCDIGMIGNNTRITGQFGQEEARDLSVLISGGALPVPVEIIEQRTVGPTLGADAIDASAKAAVIGLALTALFLIVVYRVAGFLAVIALLGYAAVSYGALIAIGATLTLPGLAGFVLAIGMAVDASVLVFERAREERGATPARAVERGYAGAWTAIIDSNVTTLLAAGLLFALASGPVRGFGVTLSIGVLAALFATLVLGRVLLMLGLRERMGKATGLAHQGRVRLWVNRQDAGFLRKPARWLAGAFAAVAVALVGVVVIGPSLGLEFTGGRVLEYTTPGAVDVDRVRAEVAEAGFPRAVVQESGDNAVTVRTEPIDQAGADKVRAAVSEATGGAEQLRDEQIGPSLGDELRTKALIALGLAILAQLIYLAIRFNWRLGAATVVALVQDVLIVIGVFAWLGKPFDGVFLAALLTVIGYSVNDTVVVFDRVRELRGQNRKTPFSDVVGRAVLQTLPRTVNTGIGVLFVLGALLFLGDGSLADFALALLLGLITGTASTIVTAGPVAIVLDRKWPPPVKQAVKARPQAGDRTDGAVV
ncbi:protein translocase subunit SecD [Actinokineospora guangxiensis]|uniref:Multifunctional fusion protein n=1 Tax=Actinokineospora guangxiensis TaxID=1490288 RepID=A0ABW0EQG4_9PSEU